MPYQNIDATVSAADVTAIKASFDAAGFKRDADLLAVLTELGTIAASVAGRIDDTRMAVGSEAKKEADLVYKYAKDAQASVPGIKTAVDKLGARYAKLTGPHKKKPA